MGVGGGVGDGGECFFLGGGCQKIYMKKMHKQEKTWACIKNLGGKNPKNGRKTFLEFFPETPPALYGEIIS